jgi:hypothetical protein
MSPDSSRRHNHHHCRKEDKPRHPLKPLADELVRIDVVPPVPLDDPVYAALAAVGIHPKQFQPTLTQAHISLTYVCCTSPHDHG